MNEAKPISIILDGRTYQALEALAANDGYSPASFARFLIGKAIDQRLSGYRPPIERPERDRRDRITAQAQTLQNKFKRELSGE